MPTVSMKYFKDHVPASVFDNQSGLANILISLGHRSFVESDDISPLTLRMFKIQSGLVQVEKCVHDLRPLAFPIYFNQQGQYQGAPTRVELFGTQAPSGSIEYVHSYVTPRNQWTVDPYTIPPIESYRFEQVDVNEVRIISNNSKVHTFSLHSGNYDFFVNLDSAFDRIRLELNSIYFDGAKVLDKKITKGCRYWSEYTDNNQKSIKAMRAAGYNAIADILTGASSLSLEDRTGKYRNRLIHDGDLEVYIDKQTGRVFLPDDPLINPITFTTELLLHLNSVYDDIQKLFKYVYGETINDLTRVKKIPLI